MGLFSNLRAQSSAPVQNHDIAKSVLTIPFLTAASDGNIDESEQNQIMNMCAYSPIFHGIGFETTRTLWQELDRELRASSYGDVFVRAKAHLTPKLAETAMCFAIRTALADGVLEDDEKEILVTMSQHLGLPESKFVQIFEVMLMMQRPAAA